MKKIFIRAVLFYLIIFGAIIISADNLSVGVNEDEVRKIQEGIDNYVPINEDGEFDPSGLKTKAEIRIEKINQWLESNAKWLKVVFGMVPEVSWLFAFVLYFWLFFLAQALNARVVEIFYDTADFFGNLSKRTPSDDMIPLSWAQVVGLGFFALFVVLKIPVGLGNLAYNTFIADYGISIYIMRTVLVISLIAIYLFFPKLTRKLLLILRRKIRKRSEETGNVNLKILDNTVKGMMQGN
jgi:hypothetical protein